MVIIWWVVTLLPSGEGGGYITLINKEIHISNCFYTSASSVVVRPLLPLTMSNMQYRTVFSLLATLLINTHTVECMTYPSSPSYLLDLYSLFKTILFLDSAILFIRNLVSYKLLIINLLSSNVFTP